jgi:hypothetical protein
MIQPNVLLQIFLTPIGFIVMSAADIAFVFWRGLSSDWSYLLLSDSRVSVFSFHHLRTGTDTVSETLWFLDFRTAVDGQRDESH